MPKRFVILIYVAISAVITLAAQDIDLNKPLNQANYQEWDEYIKKNAPSQAALNVVVNLANRHYYAGRAAVALEVWNIYKGYFPTIQKEIKQQTDQLEALMLSQAPQEDMRYLYARYIENNSNTENGFVALQRLTDRYINLKMWDSATVYYQYYKKIFPKFSTRFEKIINILNAKEVGLRVNNLGEIINSHYDEWDPTPSGDGKTLYFSSRFKYPNYGNSDVYFSTLDSAGKWSKPQNIGKEINGKMDETVDNISTDGNILLLSGDFLGTFGHFDIYYTDKTETGWSSVKHLPMPINTEWTDEGANLSSDGNVLLFTSDRPGGVGEFHEYGTLFHGNVMGNMDIYVSIKGENGWGEPINIGKNVNTQFSERAPYLHPDGKTLYFSSDGHAGLGKMDLFVTKRLNDTSWTEWSEPVNLGKEINTANDDWGYAVSLSGDSAFFAAYNRPDGKGGWDLYSISLPENAKPDQVVTIRGRVTNNSHNPLPAVIKWEDLETGKKIGEVRANPQNGEYFIVLPLGKNYGYYAEYSNYYPTSGNINLTKVESNKDINNNLVLVSQKEIISQNAKITVNNIFFDFNKYELKSESYPELDRLIEFLKKNLKKSVIVEGHTDNVGTDDFNQKLSEKRAEAVKKYLVSKGISQSAIKIIGYGSKKPVVDNLSEENRLRNRRVEIQFE